MVDALQIAYENSKHTSPRVDDGGSTKRSYRSMGALVVPDESGETHWQVVKKSLSHVSILRSNVARYQNTEIITADSIE
jgi:hypothetical protein